MYKVWILGVGENTWATNGRDFDTIEAARNYGNDLLSRWFGADRFAILPLDDKFKGFLSHDTINNNKVS